MFQAPPDKPLNHFRLLGHSGLRVSPLCLGTMTFGTNWKDFYTGEITKEEAEKIFDAYIAAGGNFIDTANAYQNGQSEEWLGEWIEEKGLRDDVVIATKYSLPVKVGSPNMGGNQRASMMRNIEKSLRRLRTHFIDVYYLHVWDFCTPVEEIMRGLNDLVSSGKVHYLGISDTPGWRVAQMNTLARERGWSEFVCYQGRYHLGERDIERDIMPMCKELGLGFVSWGILGQGKYTGRFKRGEKDEGQNGRKGIKMTEKDYDIAEVVVAIAEEVGRTPSQVCIAWMLSQPNNFPLLGVRSLSQFEDNLSSMSLKLTEDQIERINKVATIDLGFPHIFIGTSIETSPWLKSGGIIETK